MAKAKTPKPFSVEVFLSTLDGQRSVSEDRKQQKVFSQGDAADAVYYVQQGQVKVCVISERGKEAVVALHGKGDFFGEGCLTGQPLRLATHPSWRVVGGPAGMSPKYFSTRALTSSAFTSPATTTIALPAP